MSSNPHPPNIVIPKHSPMFGHLFVIFSFMIVMHFKSLTFKFHYSKRSLWIDSKLALVLPNTKKIVNQLSWWNYLILGWLRNFVRYKHLYHLTLWFIFLQNLFCHQCMYQTPMNWYCGWNQMSTAIQELALNLIGKLLIHNVNIINQTD